MSLDVRARRGQALTLTELEIVRRLAAGDHDTEIAKALSVSDRTYRRYVRSAQAKLAARTRAHLVVVALRRGLIHLRGNR